MFANIWNNIRNWLIALAATAAGVFALLFLYWKNKAEIDEALLHQQEMNKLLEKHDHNIEKNNEELAKEEAYRKELEKNEKTDSNVIDIAKRFGK